MQDLNFYRIRLLVVCQNISTILVLFASEPSSCTSIKRFYANTIHDCVFVIFHLNEP